MFVLKESKDSSPIVVVYWTGTDSAFEESGPPSNEPLSQEESANTTKQTHACKNGQLI